MKKIILTALPALLMATIVSAQNEDDAYRLSMGTPASTALSLGMGGVGASMGGDFNTLSINPSGIAVYRSGEISITPVYKFGTNKSNVEGSSSDARNSKMSLANLGIIMHRNLNAGNWRSVSFGLGMNTIANYNQKFNAQMQSDKTSITDVFAATAQELGTSETVLPPYGFLGFQGYLLDGSLNSVIPVGTNLLHNKEVQHFGSKKEYTLSIGGNYAEKFLIGATVGINSMDYVKHTVNTEQDRSGNTDNDFQSLELLERIGTSGMGVNVKIGGTYVVSPMLKFGLAVHTPTWFSLTDIMDYRLESNTENFKADAGFPDTNPVSIAQPTNGYQFNYSLSTPWRLVAGGTALIRNMGMLSADYEYVPYHSMRYKMADDRAYETIVNNNIKNKYTASHILRLGGELVFDNIFLRAGGAYHSSPLQQSATYGGARTDFSVGAGLRYNNFFLDLGYMHSRMKTSDLLHDVSAANSLNPVISSNGKHNQIALTLGMKFRK